MEASAEDWCTLQSLEEALWSADTRFDLRRTDSVLASDFFEFGRSGRVYAVLPLPEFWVRLLDDDTAQVTYNSAVKCDGVVEHARRSSIWSRTATGWTLRFHQGTPYQP